ncbi:hypothetical protein LEMLEM_LOCUS25360 [Lemmus lemmus]
MFFTHAVLQAERNLGNYILQVSTHGCKASVHGAGASSDKIRTKEVWVPTPEPQELRRRSSSLQKLDAGACGQSEGTNASREVPSSQIQARDQNNTKDLRYADEVVTISEMELRIKSLESQLATRGAQRSLPERVLPSEHHCAGERAMTQPLRRELGEQASRSPQK